MLKKDDGYSALHLADGHQNVVDTLIRVEQADLDLRNNRNQSAFLLAVSQGHCGLATNCRLIQMGIDLDALNAHGFPAPNFLADNSHQEHLKSYKPSPYNMQA